MEFENLTAELRSLIARRMPRPGLPVNGEREACEAWYHQPPNPLLEGQITSGVAILDKNVFTFVSETDVVTLPIFPESRAYFHPAVRMLVICQRKRDHTFQFVVDSGLGLAADRAFSSSSSELQLKLDSHWLAPHEVRCARQLRDELESGEFLLGVEAGNAAPLVHGAARAVIGYTNTRLLVKSVASAELISVTWDEVLLLDSRKKLGGARLVTAANGSGIAVAVQVRDRFADRIDREWAMRSTPRTEWKTHEA